MSDPAALSVVIPTIGRAELLRACLDSLSACDVRADEVLVVDQSGGDVVSGVVADFASIGARVVRCEGRGTSLAMNLGLREARHDIVLVTHDDCTVETSWVGVARSLMVGDEQKLVTGRVRAHGDPRAVPSIKESLVRHDYTGQPIPGALWPNNMIMHRPMALALGGFDQRLPVSEDNDFGYRWVRAGHRLHYEPELVVWHHDHRTHDELEQLYVRYADSQGMLYAKHLRRGDLRMLRFIARDVRNGLMGLAARVIRGRPRWSDERQGLLPGLIGGLVTGWRVFREDQAPRPGDSGH